MTVQAHGRGHDGRKFRETCQTMVVNSHGGLLLLKHEIDQGEMIVLTNPDTDEEQECRVVFLGEPGDNGQRVGVIPDTSPPLLGLRVRRQRRRDWQRSHGLKSGDHFDDGRHSQRGFRFGHFPVPASDMFLYRFCGSHLPGGHERLANPAGDCRTDDQ